MELYDPEREHMRIMAIPLPSLKCSEKGCKRIVIYEIDGINFCDLHVPKKWVQEDLRDGEDVLPLNMRGNCNRLANGYGQVYEKCKDQTCTNYDISFDNNCCCGCDYDSPNDGNCPCWVYEGWEEVE